MEKSLNDDVHVGIGFDVVDTYKAGLVGLFVEGVGCDCAGIEFAEELGCESG